MSDDLWIVIPNWERFQHYKDRNPTWVKLYTELNQRDEWRRLSVGSRGVLVSLWCEYGAANGQIRARDVTGRIGQKVRREHWDSLLEQGFVRFSASKPLAIRYQNASPRALAREETETEEQDQEQTHPPLPVANNDGQNGWVGGTENGTPIDLWHLDLLKEIP